MSDMSCNFNLELVLQQLMTLFDKYRNYFNVLFLNCKCDRNNENRLLFNDLENQFETYFNAIHKYFANIQQIKFNFQVINDNLNNIIERSDRNNSVEVIHRNQERNEDIVCCDFEINENRNAALNRKRKSIPKTGCMTRCIKVEEEDTDDNQLSCEQLNKITIKQESIVEKKKYVELDKKLIEELDTEMRINSSEDSNNSALYDHIPTTAAFVSTLNDSLLTESVESSTDCSIRSIESASTVGRHRSGRRKSVGSRIELAANSKPAKKRARKPKPKCLSQTLPENRLSKLAKQRLEHSFVVDDSRPTERLRCVVCEESILTYRWSIVTDHLNSQRHKEFAKSYCEQNASLHFGERPTTVRCVGTASEELNLIADNRMSCFVGPVMPITDVIVRAEETNNTMNGCYVDHTANDLSQLTKL